MLESYFEREMGHYVPGRRLEAVAEAMPFLRGRFETHRGSYQELHRRAQFLRSPDGAGLSRRARYDTCSVKNICRGQRSRREYEFLLQRPKTLYEASQ